MAFFNIRVFNPCTQSNHQSLQATYKTHTQLKRRQYDQRVLREIEHGSLTPLVLSTTRGMEKAATIFYKRLASFLSDKRDENYSHTMGWLRCRLSFALLQASIMCIRGARSSVNRPILDSPIDLKIADSPRCLKLNLIVYHCITFL